MCTTEQCASSNVNTRPKEMPRKNCPKKTRSNEEEEEEEEEEGYRNLGQTW
jgi:hypothetical protein